MMGEQAVHWEITDNEYLQKFSDLMWCQCCGRPRCNVPDVRCQNVSQTMLNVGICWCGWERWREMKGRSNTRFKGNEDKVNERRWRMQPNWVEPSRLHSPLYNANNFGMVTAEQLYIYFVYDDQITNRDPHVPSHPKTEDLLIGLLGWTRHSR